MKRASSNSSMGWLRHPLVSVLLTLQALYHVCTASLPAMPFHIADNGGYAVEMKSSKRIKYNGKKYDHLLIQFRPQDDGRDEVHFYLNNAASWDGVKRYPVPKHLIRFDDKDDEVEVEWGTYFFSNKHHVRRCWYMHPKPTGGSDPTHRTFPIPVKTGLQRLQVLVHRYVRNKLSSVGHLPRSTMEDVASLAGLSMLAYYDELKVGHRFDGGTVNKIVLLPDVKMHTNLLPPHKSILNVGELKTFAWSWKDVFVVVFRGTHDTANWSVNFKLKAARIDFKGYGAADADDPVQGDIHSGIYEIMHRHLDDFLSVFDKYAGQKRVIFSGHSLGSGLAQAALLHLLNVENKDSLPPKVRSFLYERDRDPECSLEVLSFAGPAMMDKTLDAALKKALDTFNAKSTSAPQPDFSAIVFYKLNDPISVSGRKSYEYLKDVLSVEWSWSISKLYFKVKRGYKTNRALGLDGLKNVLRYDHFGNTVVLRSSPFNSFKEAIDMFAHAEYLEAHFFSIKDKGRLGWILDFWNKKKT